MKSESFLDIKSQLNLESGKWSTLYEIDSIVLKDGRGIYPNFRFMRFLFTNDSIYIKHGNSIPYGGRLINKFILSSTQRHLSFPYGSLISSVQYHEDFREPKEGDVLVVNNLNGSIKKEALILKITRASNGTSMEVSAPIGLDRDILLSFYDPKEYEKESCVHSDIIPGVYLKFEENSVGQNNKKYGKYQEIIKSKNIESINLKLVSKKIYNVK